MQNRLAKFALIFFLLVLFMPAFAQNDHRADSLKAVLKKEVSDSVKVNTYNQLADYYRYRDVLQHQEYALKAIQTARVINYGHGLASGYNMYGQYFENSARFELALLYYDSAGTRWGQLGNDAEVAHMYLNMANVYNRMGDYPNAAEFAIRALKNHEKNNNTFGKAACQLTLGNVYYQQGDTDGALSSYKKAFVMNRLSNKNPDFKVRCLAILVQCM